MSNEKEMRYCEVFNKKAKCHSVKPCNECSLLKIKQQENPKPPAERYCFDQSICTETKPCEECAVYEDFHKPEPEPTPKKSRGCKPGQKPPLLPCIKCGVLVSAPWSKGRHNCEKAAKQNTVDSLTPKIPIPKTKITIDHKGNVQNVQPNPLSEVISTLAAQILNVEEKIQYYSEQLSVIQDKLKERVDQKEKYTIAIEALRSLK